MTQIATPFVETVGFQILVAMSERYDCGLCRRRFSEPWIVLTDAPYPDNVKISGEWAFHWHDSHGYPLELLQESVNEAIFIANGVADRSEIT